MKEEVHQLVSSIRSLIKEGLEQFNAQRDSNTLSDIYLYLDEENISLVIFDDMENKLAERPLSSEFVELSERKRTEDLILAAKRASEELLRNGDFDAEYIYKPFAVSLIDSDFIVSEELLFIDDETLKLNDSLLADLDKELNDFLNKLMK